MARKLPWPRVLLLLWLAGIGLAILENWLAPGGIAPKETFLNQAWMRERLGTIPGWIVQTMLMGIMTILVLMLAVVMVLGAIFLIPAYVVWRLILVPYVGLTYEAFDRTPQGWFQQAEHVAILLGMFAIGGFALFVSWAWWTSIIPRVGAYFGTWNPFGWSDRRPRRWVLEAITGYREWREAHRFGLGASAGWAGLIETLSHGYRPGDIFLGRPKLPIGGMMRPIGIPAEKHFVTIAGTGSGKSSGPVVVNLTRHEGSLLCIDPKGELAMITGAMRQQTLGQAVWVMDPYRTVPNWQGCSYNVFDELAAVAVDDPDAPVSYADKIAQALVKDINEKDPYWDKASRTLLAGLILYIFVHEPEDKRHLPRLRQLLLEGDVEDFEKAVAAGIIDPKGKETPFGVMLEKMKTTKVRNGPYGGVIAGNALSIDRMGANQLGGVITNAQEHTSFLDAPEIQRVSMKSDFLLADLKKTRMSVYLCLPFNAVSGKQGSWLRMFVVLLVDMMTRRREPQKDPILILLDEFPSLGHLDVEGVASTLRSYGVRLWVIGQDIQQFQKVYPNSWSGFIGGAEAVQFMGVTEPITVEYITKLLGQHTVVTDQWNDGRNTRTVRGEKPLLDPDQVARLLARKRKNQIVWRGESKPLLLKTTPYFKYLPWWAYDPDPRYPEHWARRLTRWWHEKKSEEAETPKPEEREEVGV